MSDAGLLDGDIAVVDRSVSAKADDMVVAVVDGEITVKWLRAGESPAVWVLEPANAAYEPIRPKRSIEILGVVTGSFRRFRR
jgi:repressor LexA